MGYRKQPFGYRMEKGEIVIHAKEAEIVQKLYRDYIAGFGFSCLADRLNSHGVEFDVGKPWNKNMIARLLEDARYVGAKEYPAIITEDERTSASELRRGKSAPCGVTVTQKILRRLCGHKPSKNMELQVLRMTNRLAGDPTMIQCPAKREARTEASTAISSELDKLLAEQPVNEDVAMPLILKLASARYEEIGNEEYETDRLRRIFSQTEPMCELSSNLVQETLSSISITRNGTIEIKLKNGQIMEGGSSE